MTPSVLDPCATQYRGLMSSTAAPAPPPLDPAPGAERAPTVVTPLTEPSDGLGPVVDTPAAFARVVEAFAAASGPVAADAERASGYRYGQRTYLVQVRREGAGTALVDPVGVPDLSPLREAVGDAEWVLHAASQDLPGLAEHGIVPASVFDTEIAARLLGMARVGLAAVVAEVLGLGLAKEHSAVDWSTRPLPEDWLRYAALDVEVLVPLRQALGERLDEAGKSEWAAQEFEAVRTAGPPAPRPEPWRRTSGTHTLRDPRRLAVVRSLWEARDATARARDIAPGASCPTARSSPRPRRCRARRASSSSSRRSRAGHAPPCGVLAARGRRRARPARERPADHARTAHRRPAAPARVGGPRPGAAARLEAARAVVQELAERYAVPVENVLQPDALRRLCWTPPEPADADGIAAFLRGRGAREWQVGLVAEPLADAFERAGER